MRTISFIDLKAQYRKLKPLIKANLDAVLEHGAFIGGPEIGALEAQLKELTGAGAVVACASGTDALIMALMAEGVGPGDAVFVPAFTYNATVNAVLLVGATPVFVDVDPETFTIDLGHLADRIAAVEKAGTLKPRAVIPVDLYGLPADYPGLAPIAQRHGLFVLADAAQALGGALGNRAIGSLAPVTATSFFPTKTLGGYGDGGAIFCDTPERAKILESIRWHGTDDAKKESIRVGLNGRLDSMQAAVLLAKLTVFREEIARRQTLAAIYTKALAGKSGITLQRQPQGFVNACGLFTVRLADRPRVQAALAEAKMPSAIYYATPMHLHAAFAPYGEGMGSLPVCEAMAREVLTLPLHPYLEDDDVAAVAEVVKSAL